MAHDMENVDAAGKDMSMADTEPECIESGCTNPAKRGYKRCPKHAE